MLSAVSGGEVIQDVPACFAGNILDDNYVVFVSAIAISLRLQIIDGFPGCGSVVDF